MCPHKPQSCILSVLDFRADAEEVLPTLIAQQMGLLCPYLHVISRAASAYLFTVVTPTPDAGAILRNATQLAVPAHAQHAQVLPVHLAC